MFRRILPIVLLGALLALTAACTNKKSPNPLANIGSKQPDKVLFDKAMDAMRHNRFDVARLTLQTLINTYPDSEYVARAKLSECDSWYAEGGTASLAQSEQCYGDFEIFFPNMAEAAEAQLKIADIHYQQMEKADRDYTHAKRAEDEYRKLIMTYPDSKLIPEAKRKLLEVQEVLADREFDIGRFYYLRESYPASIARLKSLLEEYPLYSRADEAAWLLGQDYEGQAARIRSAPTCDQKMLPRGCVTEAAKARYQEELTKEAAAAYDKILTRYPLMDRADDAKKRLVALHQAVPRPTKAAVAQNKAEIASRGETTMMQRVTGIIKKGPDVARATQVGEPNLVEPEPVAPTDVVRQETMGAMGAGEKTATVEVVKPDQGAATAATPVASPLGQIGQAPAAASTAAADPNELKPTAPADSNELTPNPGSDQTLPPPTQVNELAQGQTSSTDAAKNADSTPASDEDISSSKKKPKKGIKKIIPF